MCLRILHPLRVYSTLHQLPLQLPRYLVQNQQHPQLRLNQVSLSVCQIRQQHQVDFLLVPNLLFLLLQNQAVVFRLEYPRLKPHPTTQLQFSDIIQQRAILLLQFSDNLQLPSPQHHQYLENQHQQV